MSSFPEVTEARRAIIVGGATGIGRAVADHMMARGAGVGLYSRRHSALEEAAAHLSPAYPGVPVEIHASHVATEKLRQSPSTH